MSHNEHLKVVKFRPIICDTFLQIFISAMFVMGIAESLTVDRKTREIALLCKNCTIKLWTWFQPVFKLLFRGFRQFKLKNHELSSWSPVPQYITGLSIAYRLLDKIQIMI